MSLAAPDVRRVAQVISGAGSYDFGPTEVEIAVTDDASCLTGITVQRHNSSHPSTIPGIESDKYWQISPNEGCESGFEVSMTMPASVTPSSNARICRFTGSQWDCDSAGTNTTTGSKMWM